MKSKIKVLKVMQYTILTVITMTIIAFTLVGCGGNGDPISPPSGSGDNGNGSHIHNWSVWIITSNATETQGGVEIRTCSGCGQTQTRTTSPTGPANHVHSWGNWTQIALATCTEVGTEIRICTIDQTHKETQTIPALGHNWSAWVINTPSTEIQGGVEISSCSRCGQTQTRVTPPTGSGNSGTLPDAPINITASAISSSSITISWTLVPSAYRYYVYRSSSASATYSRVAISSYAFFTDSGLSEGSTYFYKVSAYNDTGEGPQSASVSATTSVTVSTPIPNAPTNVTATVEATARIRVTWSAVSEAQSYAVYYSVSVDGDYKYGISSTTTSTIMDLSPETVYYIVVYAFNSSGQSPHSSPVSVTTKAMMPGTGGDIVGRWGIENGTSYNFGSRGTYRVFFYSEIRSEGRYSVSNGILTMVKDYTSSTYYLFSYSVSETGDTLTIVNAYGGREILPRWPNI